MGFDFSGFGCAIFDLDGTLVDSTGVWAQIDIDFLGSRGIEVPPDFMQAIKTHNFQTGSVYAVQRFGLDEKPEDVAREWYGRAKDAYANTLPLKSHALEFLTFLKGLGLRLAVATSSDRALYVPCLERNGVYGLFDSFTQTDEVERGKGYPDVYERAAYKCGTEISRCIVFEDILKGVEGAVDGGFFTVGVWDSESAKDEMRIRQICSLFIRDYAELL